jgi:thiol-disulfide isomerase/thioredoxin
MKSIVLSFLLTLIFFSCKKQDNSVDPNQSETETENTELASSEIPTLNYNQLKSWLNKEDDKTYVVNFWATWCMPCIKELPYFENVNSKYEDKNVEVILVSLDFPKKKESSLIPFVKNKNIKSKVLHLDDTNEQFWIGDIAQSWSGAIPATLIYNKGKREFYEQSFTQEELETEIQTFLN